MIAEAPWVSGRVPNGYWDTRENRVRYLHWLGQRCGFSEPEDWYRLRFTHFRENQGRGLVSNCYRDSILKALRDLRPDYPWLPWKLACVPQFFWDDVENRREYMAWLGEQLGFTSPEAWYGLRRESFRQHDGSGLLQRKYNDSIYSALADFMPEYPWLPWKLSCVPKGYWDVPANRHRYMDWLGEQLGYVTTEDWYQVSQDDFRNFDGAGLLHSQFNDSVLEALRDYRGDFEWLPWRLVRVPQGFWQRAENRRRYMDWLGDQLGFTNAEDWYQLTGDLMNAHHGGGLLQNYYGGSPLKALREYLPAHAWKPWLFASAPQNVWVDGETRRSYFNWLSTRLGFTAPEQLRQLRSEDFRMHFGASLLAYYQSLAAKSPARSPKRTDGLWAMIEELESNLRAAQPTDVSLPPASESLWGPDEWMPSSDPTS